MEHDITVVDLTAQPTAVVRSHAAPETIADVLGRAYDVEARVVAVQGRRLVGPPFARYLTMGKGGWDLEAGFPVDAPVVADGDVVPGTLPGGTAATLVHVGPYDTIGEAWSRASTWLVDHGYAATDAPWECYLDEPGVEQPRTLIMMPCSSSRS